MSIPKELLLLTESRAPGIAVYGAAGLKKTNAIHTLPPPILDLEFEGGTSSILPWIRRKKESGDTPWIEYTQELRQQAYDILNEKVKATVKIAPAPLIDVIHYDNTTFISYEHFIADVAGLRVNDYCSVALDSLQEFSADAQTFSKGKGNEGALMGDVNFGWSKAQERAQMALRKLKNYRDQGIVIYLIGSEDISKDYVNSPLEKRKPGQAPAEPYNIRGTVNLPGKLAEGLAHIPDILCHARLMSGNIVWVTKPEPITGGDAFWDGKDRFGRLEEYMSPSIRTMFVKLYGEEIAKKIYGLQKRESGNADYPQSQLQTA